MDRKKEREKKLLENKEKSRECNQWILTEIAGTREYANKYPEECD